MAGLDDALGFFRQSLLQSVAELNSTSKKIEIEFLVIRYFPILFLHLIKERLPFKEGKGIDWVGVGDGGWRGHLYFRRTCF